MSGWKNCVVLITGGTPGIGLETVRYFHKIGYKVATCCSSRSKTDRIKEFYNGERNFLVDTVDVCDQEKMNNFLDQIEAPFGKIDILINNGARLGPNLGLTD